jgi:cephalosporin-C deacetylase-like acetyl esterase
MCAPLDLQVVSKRPQNEEKPSNFHEFWSEELQPKSGKKKKKNLMFERCNFIDPMELGAITF